MKLTKSKLKQLIKEVFEGESEELPAEFQYEYLLDELVDAARDAVMPLAVEKLKEVGALSEEEGRGLTYNDLELEIEEPLLDALKPLAKLIQGKIDHAPDRETEEEDEGEYEKLRGVYGRKTQRGTPLSPTQAVWATKRGYPFQSEK